MTRRLRLVPVMIVMLAMWPVTSDAQNIPVKWGAGASSLAGVDFLLPLEIDMSARADLVGSFSLVARWDTTKIRLMGGDASDFGEITVNDDSLIAGVLLASGANPAGIGGKFSVLSARFRPLVDDTTTITLDVTELFAAGTFDDLTSLVVSSDKAYCAALGRYGDLDGDGSANSRDALIALSSVVGLDVPFNPSLGDVDGDGQTEAMDALVILSNAVGLNVSAFRVFVIAPGACVSTQIQPGFAVIPGDQELLEGQVLDLRAQGTDANGDLVTLTDVFWRTSDDQIVTVTPNGEAVGLSAGVATITAIRAGTTDSTNITLTVLASRTTHWVDRAAFLNPNQIGSAILPFGSINDAIDTANEGDTVRVLPGRYDEQVSVGKSIIVIGEPVVTPSNGVDRVTGIGTYPV
ncbi:MAG: Ig-like domain-containing protein, partial [Gemmatimonadales bacterium]